MRKMLLTPLMVCMVGLLSTLLMPTVLACAKPEHVTGYLHYCPHLIPPVKIAYGNVYMNTWEEGEWHGGIEGQSRDEPCRVVIYGADAFPPTKFDFRCFVGISKLKECEVDGKKGGLVILLAGKAKFGEDWHGMWAILGGTGELRGIYGFGTWWGPGAKGPETWGDVDYEGWITLRA